MPFAKWKALFTMIMLSAFLVRAVPEDDECVAGTSASTSSSLATSSPIAASSLVDASSPLAASPSPAPSPTNPSGGMPNSDEEEEEAMVKVLESVAPNSAVESCVDDPEAPKQCRTAKQAAGPIVRSFEKYDIKTPGEKAALLSLMAMETAEFKYQRNVFPGRPGQGTRNMQMAEWNKKYAASIPELKEKFEPVKDDDDAVLDLLVANDDYDFGSAAWYLTTQCAPDIQKELQKGTDEAWEEYISECVGTTVTDERKKYLGAAKDALEE